MGDKGRALPTTGLFRSWNSIALAQRSTRSLLSAPAVPTHLELPPADMNVLAASSDPMVLGATDMGGTLPKEQDKGPGLCSHRQFPVKELM